MDIQEIVDVLPFHQFKMAVKAATGLALGVDHPMVLGVDFLLEGQDDADPALLLAYIETEKIKLPDDLREKLTRNLVLHLHIHHYAYTELRKGGAA